MSSEPFSDTSDDETREETVGDCRGAVEDSDVELDDSEDPLKHAGIYTSEEITLITRDKLIKLQSLYAEYLNVLKRRYGRKRVEFHKRIKTEKDTVGPLRVSAVTPRQKLKLEQLASWRRYHRRFGEEGLLYQQSQKRRRLEARAPSEHDSESIQLCNALVNGMDCGEVALPNSSMCAKHILCDSKQVLFIKCDVEDCRNVCIPVSDVKTCWFHQRSTESIRHDFSVPWGSFVQATGGSSSNQRSSMFPSLAPPLRIFPPVSSSNGGSAQASPTLPSTPQKSPVGGRGGKKRATGGVAIPHGRRDGMASTKKGHHRVGVGLQPSAMTAAELRNAPPLPISKHPSFDEMSAEAGVYGAYMTSAEPSEGSAQHTMMESGVAGIRVEASIGTNMIRPLL